MGRLHAISADRLTRDECRERAADALSWAERKRGCSPITLGLATGYDPPIPQFTAEQAVHAQRAIAYALLAQTAPEERPE